MKIVDILKKLKPGVPKRVLFFAAASVWGFASSRILKIGFNDIISNTEAYWLNFFIGVIGFFIFFKYVFYKMYKKHTKRIINLDIERPCIFSFFDLKGFGIMVLMITGGVTLRNSHIVPPLYMGTFYVTLGLSLFSAAVSFLYTGIRYQSIKVKYLENNNLEIAAE